MGRGRGSGAERRWECSRRRAGNGAIRRHVRIHLATGMEGRASERWLDSLAALPAQMGPAIGDCAAALAMGQPSPLSLERFGIERLAAFEAYDADSTLRH